MEEEPSSTSILTRQAVMAALELPLETVSKRSIFSLEALEKKSDITRAFPVQNWSEQKLLQLQANAFLALQRFQNCKRCSSAMHYADVQLN